jgi:hypothetical protein
VPVHPAHPDPEELAAWQAGDLSGPGGARVEAHVAACAHCAGLVAAVERGRDALAGLGEVDLPPGLHERLAAAIEAEVAGAPSAGTGSKERRRAAAPGAEERRLAAAGANGGPEERRLAAAAAGAGHAAAGNGHEAGESRQVAEPIPLDGRRRARGSPAGRRRVAVLSTAAAVILLVAGLVPLLRHTGGGTVATQTAGGGAAGGPVPVFSAPGGYSGAALQAALTRDPAARSAYQRAANAAARLSTAAPQLQRDSGGGEVAPSAGAGSADNSTKRAEGGNGAAATEQVPSELHQDACLASARNQARDQGLQPAFFVTTVYRDRPATVLVTVRPGAPDKAVLWAFPIGNCSAPPFAQEPVTVTPP